MNRRVYTLTAGAAICLTLSACGTRAGEEPSSPSTAPAATASQAAAPTPTQETPTETPSPAAPPDGHTYNVAMEDVNGYKVTATFVLGDAIHDDYGQTLMDSWRAVGGTGSVPCVGETHGGADSNWDKERSAFSFGTLTLHNDSNGFSIDSFPFYVINHYASGDYSALGIGYSSGSECDDLLSRMIHPDFNGSDDWGPVPIVFAFDQVFTPNHPDGGDVPLTDDAGIQFLPMSPGQVTDGNGKVVSGIKFKLAQ